MGTISYILNEFLTFLFLPILFVRSIYWLLAVFIVFVITRFLIGYRTKYSILITIMLTFIGTYAFYKIFNPTGAGNVCAAFVNEKIVPSMKANFQNMPKMDISKFCVNSDSSSWHKQMEQKLSFTAGTFFYEISQCSNLVMTLRIYSLEETTLSEEDIKRIRDLWREINPTNSDSFIDTFFTGFFDVWKIKPPYSKPPFLKVSLVKGYCSSNYSDKNSQCKYLVKWIW